MAATRLQTPAGAKVDLQTAVTNTWTTTTTPGSTLIACLCAMSNADGAGAVSPPAGWTLFESSQDHNSVSTPRIWIYVIENASARSGGESFSWTNASDAVLFLTEYGSMEANSDDAKSNTSNSSGSTAMASGTTAVTVQDDEVAVGAMMYRRNEGHGALSNSFTQIESVITDGASATEKNTAVFFEKILAAAGAQNTGATLNVSRPWAGAIATFKAATAPPPATVVPRKMLLGVGV